MLDGQAIRVRMGKIVDIFVNDISSIRTGRATAGLIENVVVTVYEGKKMRLVELGAIGVPDARSLTFTPWDQSIIKEIKNGIAAANMGMNPAIDGQLIRMTLPALTVEQREDYVRLLGRKLEGVRGMVRDARGEQRRDLQKAKQKKRFRKMNLRWMKKSCRKLPMSIWPSWRKYRGKKRRKSEASVLE